MMAGQISGGARKPEPLDKTSPPPSDRSRGKSTPTRQRGHQTQLDVEPPRWGEPPWTCSCRTQGSTARVDYDAALLRRTRTEAAADRIAERRGELGILADRIEWLDDHEHWWLRELRWRREGRWSS
jgi:hypothetical protein